MTKYGGSRGKGRQLRLDDFAKGLVLLLQIQVSAIRGLDRVLNGPATISTLAVVADSASAKLLTTSLP